MIDCIPSPRLYIGLSFSSPILIVKTSSLTFGINATYFLSKNVLDKYFSYSLIISLCSKSPNK